MLNKNLLIAAFSLLLASCSYSLDPEKSGSKGIVYFSTNSSELTSSSKDFLDSTAADLTKPGVKFVKVEGHCDERGSAEYNLALGKKRADAVKNYLAKQGVKKSVISTKSYGKSKPVDFGHDEEAWAKNRRSVIISK